MPTLALAAAEFVRRPLSHYQIDSYGRLRAKITFS